MVGVHEGVGGRGGLRAGWGARVLVLGAVVWLLRTLLLLRRRMMVVGLLVMVLVVRLLVLGGGAVVGRVLWVGVLLRVRAAGVPLPPAIQPMHASQHVCHALPAPVCGVWRGAHTAAGDGWAAAPWVRLKAGPQGCDCPFTAGRGYSPPPCGYCPPARPACTAGSCTPGARI